MITTDGGLQAGSTTDEDTDADDYSTSEGDEDERNTSLEEDNGDNAEDENTNNGTPTDEDQNSLSSDDEEVYEITPVNVQNDPTLTKIRSLIKQVRELVGLVRRSSNLTDYVREKKKQMKLSGDVSDRSGPTEIADHLK